MTKYFLFFSLFLMLVWSWIPSVSAQQKYRYIKREHGVRFQGNMSFSSGLNLAAMLSGAYTYNWKGMLEAGPYFQLNPAFQNQVFSLNNWSWGLLGEYNIIKNRGKRKLIPAVGLNLGAHKSNSLSNTLHLSMGLHGALKIFVGKRTPFIISLGYNLLTPMRGFFSAIVHDVNLSMGFSYYFDIY